MMLSFNTYKINYLVLIPDHAQASLYRWPCSPPVFIKPVHFLNLGTQNAPDCVSEHLNFQNFTGVHAPGPPLVVRAFGAQLGRYAPKLSPPASLSSTSTFFEKENPAQCEAEQGNQLFLGMFYWLRVQCFFFSIKLYIGFLVSARGIKKRIISESSSNRMNNHWLRTQFSSAYA